MTFFKEGPEGSPPFDRKEGAYGVKKNNWKFIAIVVILAIVVVIVGVRILSYFFRPFSFIFFILLALLGFLPALIITFGIVYLVIWGILKLFHITDISQSKIIAFTFEILFLGFLGLSIFSYPRLKGQFIKLEELFLGLPLESEIKAGEDIYKNKKYGFEIKYFTDRLARENDYETERLRANPSLLFELIFSDSNYGWNITKTTAKPVVTIEIFDCKENNIDECLNQVPASQFSTAPYGEYSKYGKEVRIGPAEFNEFPAKKLEAWWYSPQEKMEGIAIFKNQRLYVILGFTSTREDFISMPREIFNQMLSTFKFITEEELEVLEEPYIKVIFPNGGEKWRIGETYEIKWEFGGLEKVDIYLYGSIPGQRPFSKKLATGISATLDEYSWTISEDIPSGDSFVIIINQEGEVYPRDESDNYFGIVRDETANWKIYRNEEYGYKIKHPNASHFYPVLTLRQAQDNTGQGFLE